MSDVLISGVTGRLGSALLQCLPSLRNTVLLGRDSAISLRARLRHVESLDQVEFGKVIRGDVSSDIWGLSESFDDLLNVRTIVNLAACTNWTAPWAALYGSNVVAPIEALRLAAQIAERTGDKVLVIHFGSAPATSSDEFWISETPHPLSQHATAYERSKWIGERAFLAYKRCDLVSRLLVRVSGLVGGSAASTLRAQGLSLYIRAADRSNLAILPHHRNAHLDVVPADVAANTIVRLIEQGPNAIQDCYICHLCLGETAPRVQTVIERLNDARILQGRPKLRAISAPPRGSLAALRLVDRFIPLQKRTQTDLMGIRYLMTDRMYSRSNLEALIGASELPTLSLELLPELFGQVTGRREDGGRVDLGPFSYHYD